MIGVFMHTFKYGDIQNKEYILFFRKKIYVHDIGAASRGQPAVDADPSSFMRTETLINDMMICVESPI
jgi:hypothetical protein